MFLCTLSLDGRHWALITKFKDRPQLFGISHGIVLINDDSNTRTLQNLPSNQGKVNISINFTYRWNRNVAPHTWSEFRVREATWQFLQRILLTLLDLSRLCINTLGTGCPLGYEKLPLEQCFIRLHVFVKLLAKLCKREERFLLTIEAFKNWKSSIDIVYLCKSKYCIERRERETTMQLCN